MKILSKKIISIIIVCAVVLATFSISCISSGAMESVKGSFDYLTDYIRKNGQTVENEEVKISDTVQVTDGSYNLSLIYSPKKDSVYFNSIHNFNGTSISFSVIIDETSEKYLAMVTYTHLGTDQAYAYIQPQTYNYESLEYTFSLSYSDTEEYKSTTSALFDSEAKQSVTLWNDWIVKNVGINLGNFGFTKLFKSIALPDNTVYCTVTFNANGGSVSTTSATVEMGKATTLPTPTKSGYTCLGWAPNSKATKAAYECGASYKPTENETLYAVWQKNIVETPCKYSATVEAFPTLMIRERPDTSSAIIGFIPNGAVIDVVAESGNYAKTTYANTTGWIIKTFIKKVDPPHNHNYVNHYCSSCNSFEESYTGMAKKDSTWYYVTNGKLDTSFTGMAKNQYGWWYMKNGKLDTTYTGMAKNQYGWWYMKNGKLDTTYTGMAKNQYGWWYMKNGKLDTTYTGMAHNQYGWWYLKNGTIDYKFKGLAKNQYGWWYIQNGTINFKYNGTASNQYGTWKVVNGKVTTKA